MGLKKCRRCWQCKANYRNDWVGRCIAETKCSVMSRVVTLTYGGGDSNPHAQTLVYKDVQTWIRKLQRRYGTVRYMVCGEYGKERGRAHWHVLLCFKADGEKILPDWPLYERFDHDKKDPDRWTGWNHGYIFVEKPDAEAIAYSLKYAQKDQDDEGRVKHFYPSQYPPMGDAYFARMAVEMADKGLVPQDYGYQFADVKNKKGELRRYYLQGASLRNFIHRYEARCAEIGFEPLYREPIMEQRDIAVGAEREVLSETFEAFVAKLECKSEKMGSNWVYEPYVVKYVSIDTMNGIVKDRRGRYFHIRYNRHGQTSWQKELTSRAQIRAALRGDIVAKLGQKDLHKPANLRYAAL